MADKITQLQKELGTIIKGKKEVTDKIIMEIGRASCRERV